MNQRPTSLLVAAVFTISCCTAANAVAPRTTAPETGKALHFDRSPPMSVMQEMAKAANKSIPSGNIEEVPNIFLPPVFPTGYDGSAVKPGRGSQLEPSGVAPPAIDLSVDGISNQFGILPPDTNGDVSPNYYVQYINLGWQVFDKVTGNPVSAVLAGNTFWQGFGGACETNNSGDPIVLWDEQASVWVFSQFTGSGDPQQCFAITDSENPVDGAATYNRYAFGFSPQFNDYPHIGVWTDASGEKSGYYFVTHDFGASFEGASYSVVERDEMIAGNAASFVRFPGHNAYGALPPHLEGPTLPLTGSCAPFVHHVGIGSEYRFWSLCVDWDTPAQSTISSVSLVDGGVDYVTMVPNIAQAGTSATLDSFGSNTMYRAVARAFNGNGPTDISLVINHEANVGGGHAGIRWVHFDLPSGDTLFRDGVEAESDFRGRRVVESGVFAPDEHDRWMGAIAIDQGGNLGLGYSVSSASMRPELRISGRDFGDPAGELRDEVTCVGAGGFQSSTSGRWGDYASMSVDPVDQCTFWFTSEYHDSDSSADWNTRICSFTYDSCGSPNMTLRAGDGNRREVCATDDDPTYKLEAVQVGGYANGVNLGLLGIPFGSSASFTVNPIPSVPGSSDLTLVGGSGLADGEYGLTVTGNSTGGTPLARELTLSLGVSSAAAGSPTLVSPTDALTGVLVRPLFSWSAVPGALTYRLEVAEDSNFNTIVESVSTELTEYRITAVLNESQTYYWRVFSVNYCGDGVASAEQSFTTGVLGSCPGGSSANAVFDDDMESGGGLWTVSGSGGGNPWVLVTDPAGTGMTSTMWYAEDTASTSDKYLVSNTVAVPAGQSPVVLSFDTYRNIEDNGPGSCWDGGLLEVSTDGGSNWTQLTNDVMLTDPYTGPIVENDASPISGLDAWCAESGPLTSFVLFDDYAGQSVQLRYRMGTDGASGVPTYPGWYVDNVTVQSCQ